MGLDDVQLGFGDRDALGPVIHDTRMPVLAPATADRRCASPWARQIIIKSRRSRRPLPYRVVLWRAPCGYRARKLCECKLRQRVVGSWRSPAANRTALTASPSAQASGRGWID